MTYICRACGKETSDKKNNEWILTCDCGWKKEGTKESCLLAWAEHMISPSKMKKEAEKDG